jgi:hypothetical protein
LNGEAVTDLPQSSAGQAHPSAERATFKEREMNEDDIFSDPDNQLSQFHEEDYFDAYKEQRDREQVLQQGKQDAQVLELDGGKG